MRIETPPLKLLQIDVTEQCPLSCLHCSNSSGPLKTTHFPIERLLEIISEAKTLGAERVVYSGGEPLRYPKLESAIAHAASLGLYTSIFTTGVQDMLSRIEVVPELWRSLKRLGLKSAAFSIYSSPRNRAFHNKVVGSRPERGDAFEVNEKAIRDARTANLAIELHFVPCSANLRDLGEVYSWAVNLCCSTLNLQMPTYQGRNSRNHFLTLSHEEELLLKRSALDLKTQVGGPAFYISRLWRSRWNPSSEPGCSAANDQLIIRADGTISPCNACKYTAVTVGLENLLATNTSLTKLWRDSEVLAEVRRACAQRTMPTRCEEALAVSAKRTARTA